MDLISLPSSILHLRDIHFVAWSGFTERRINSKGTRMGEVDTSEEALLARFCFYDDIKGEAELWDEAVVDPDPNFKKSHSSWKCWGKRQDWGLHEK